MQLQSFIIKKKNIYSIKDIPYPAVTICNMNQVGKSFANSLKSKQDKVILESICTQGDSLSNEDDNVEGKWSYVRKFLLNASQPCEDMIKLCKFGMEKIDCEATFSSVLTDEGLCCTFNAVHPRLLFKNFEQQDHVGEDSTDEVEYMTWTPEKGYSNSEKTPYPKPVKGPGSNMGLTLILNADVANYHCSSTSSSGFKVLLHSPIETPKMANFGFFVSPGLETKVVITPKISEASEVIRKVPVKQRQCVFADEANLSYYNIYSKKNCEMECTSKLTEETCGCTLYYMPRTFGDGSIICNRKKASCYEKVLYDIAHSETNYSCNYCLPACFEINYDREISSSKLGTGFITSETIPSRDVNYIHNNLAIIHIFFNDNAYGGFTKSELIGFTEFLSNTGGLLGLFMGFSVISLIEIIYFLSLRPYCARKRFEEQPQTVKSEGIQLQNRFLNNSLKGAKSKSILVNEYIMRSEMYQEKNFFEKIYTKFSDALRYIKIKLMNTWNVMLEIYQGRRDKNEQAPFPYYN